LYYFAISPDFRDVAMLSMTGSSGRQRVQSKVVEEHLFSFPPLPEQRAIADVLSSLDDKIDLLDRQNQTLEALAETLFRQWFIEEANPDWEEGTLGELAEVQNGYSFKSSEFSNESDGFEVLKMGHIDKSGGLKSVPKRHYMLKESRLFKYVLQKNDIVMCMTDMKDNVVILGVPAMVDKSDHYVLNQRVARISLRKGSKILSQHILYLFLKDPIFIAELQKKANSGVQVNLTTDAIKNSLILIPPLEKQIKVVSFLDSIYSKFDLNKLQIRKLERLRDALLPKLMAGSVRVGNLSPTLSLKGEGAEEETKNPLPLGRGQGEGIL
jgi:type I restriction enzyme S subunit